MNNKEDLSSALVNNSSSFAAAEREPDVGATAILHEDNSSCSSISLNNYNNNNEVNDWEYAKDGIIMWLNNDPDGAEEHFKARMDNTKIYAGYAFTTVMNAVISYELDKIELAQSMLHELELRCTPENGWLQSFRSRIFGSKEIICKPLNDELEEKIILADCLMCSAILTFLTQDISGLMRGSWLLRRAWKIYQQTYCQIYEIYEKFEKILNEPSHKNTSKPITPIETDSDLSSIDENILPHRSSMVRSKTTNMIASKSRHSNRNNSSNSILKKSLNHLQSEGHSAARHVISHLPKNLPSKLRLDKYVTAGSTSSSSSTLNYGKMNHHNQQHLNHYSENISSSSTSSYDSSNTKYSPCPSKNNLFLDLKSIPTPKNGFIPHQVPLSCPEPISTPFTKMPPFELSDINLLLIKRLMGAVSFGYGLFQLSISLLPPNLMRFISLFGFEGNKTIGISCLTYSNNSQDMRAPLARLALLWYYTIGAQLFHIEGSNMENEILAAKHLLKESQEQYATSAIFLFFRARVKRIQCNTNVAIEFYDAAYRMSAQKELKLLCLHEVGWCRLIQLDFGNAMLHFHELRLASNFSKSFYTYMTTICQGAFGRFDNLIKLRNELMEILNRHKNRETQIDKFIMRRIDKLPSAENQKEMLNVQYFKFFIYEMLFLWNTLYSCTKDILNVIISDCSRNKDDDDNDRIIEPSIGLSDLILGCCEAHLQNFSIAINALRQCIRKREGLSEDIHVSAFAHYELAILLIKQQSDVGRQEAKTILMNAQRFFKNYDFENRLSARIYSALKNLQ